MFCVGINKTCLTSTRFFTNPTENFIFKGKSNISAFLFLSTAELSPTERCLLLVIIHSTQKAFSERRTLCASQRGEPLKGF